MNYANGKIYCIRNSVNDEIYVGSTIQRLSKRLSKHKSDNRMNTVDNKLYQEMKALGDDKFYIELIENYPCTSKEELHKREGELIRKLGTLNYQVSGRTRQQYREENREKEQIRRKVYYNNNREKELARGRRWKASNTEKVKEYQKTYSNEHKEEIKQKRTNKVTCDCGSVVNKWDFCRHTRTQKHKAYMTSLENRERNSRTETLKNQ